MTNDLNPDRLLSRQEVHAVFGIPIRYLEISGPRGDGPPRAPHNAAIAFPFADIRCEREIS